MHLYILLAIPAILARFAVDVYFQYRRLKHIPGPRSAGWSKWWLIRATWSGRTHLDYHDVCRKYGRLVRIGPNDLVTSDADLVKRILAVRSPYTRSEWYLGLRFLPWRDNILSVRDEKLHNILRSKLASGYSGKSVDNFEPKIDKAVVNLIRLVQSYVSRGAPVDLGRKVSYFSLDVISDLAYGESFDDLVSDSDKYGYVHDMATYLPTLIISTVLSWMNPVLALPVFRPFIPRTHGMLGIGRIMGIAKDVAAQRFGPDKKVERDMVGSFVAHGLTQYEAESEIAAQIVAGSDTTAAGIRATMLYIMTSPRVLAKIRQEMRQTRLSLPVATDAEIRSMTYLQAAIREVLRLFPPVTNLMSKQVPVDGDSWQGVNLPPGTRIGVCVWGICRCPDVWGADADEFRPERWLEASPEKKREMDSSFDLIFGAGKWGCLGRVLALIELNKVCVELLRRFHLSLVDPTQPWKSVNCGLFLQSEFWVRASPREVDVDGNFV